ncbi:MAG: hypothetical protein ACRCX2_27460 [Paraclostridium sp.]
MTIEKFDDVVWAMEQVYYSVWELRKKRFINLLQAMTVVADMDYENLTFVDTHRIINVGCATFTLTHDEYGSVDCKAEFFEVGGISKLSSCEIIECRERGDEHI